MPGNVVIAESSSFGGAGSQLEQLEGMQVLNLSNAYAQSMMKTFATRFPWDWAADIGEIPPKDLELSTRLLTQSWELRLFVDKISEELTKLKHTAAVIDPRGELLASSADERKESGGNETRSAVMLALGRAGSKVNLRECVLFFMAPRLRASFLKSPFLDVVPGVFRRDRGLRDSVGRGLHLVMIQLMTLGFQSTAARETSRLVPSAEVNSSGQHWLSRPRRLPPSLRRD